MDIQPRNAPLSPHRNWWVERMSPADRRSYLIAERLETLAASRGDTDAQTIRSFLVRWRKATEDENPAGLTLRARTVPKAPNHAIVSVEMPGIGRVKWMPVLVVPMSDHFTRIMRECGDLPMFPHDRVKQTDVWGQPESTKSGPPVLTKVNVQLVYSR